MLAAGVDLEKDGLFTDELEPEAYHGTLFLLSFLCSAIKWRPTFFEEELET